MKRILLLSLLLIFLQGCLTQRIQKKRTEMLTNTDKYWEEMIRNDDQKIANMKTVLDHLAGCAPQNVTRIDSVKEEVSRLSALRYKKTTMTGDQIDLYDDVTNQVLIKIGTLSRSVNDSLACPPVDSLVNEIVNADNKEVLYRVAYDKEALLYNEYISDKKLSDKPLPVFTITAE